jgi:hypothetical protein
LKTRNLKERKMKNTRMKMDLQNRALRTNRISALAKIAKMARMAGLARIAGLAAALSLAACNGPWNMEPDTAPRPIKLWASALLVAERPLDTLWLERPISLGKKWDRKAAFIDEAASEIYIVGGGKDTVRFRPSVDRPAAWLPMDTAYRVKRGTRYDLTARVRWNAAPDFPGGQAYRTETLRATTLVPRQFAFDSVFQVPVEALHRSLSVGLPAGSIGRAHSDSAYRQRLYDSLAALPGAGRFAARVSHTAFTDFIHGKAAFVPVRGEDTLHYIFDDSPVIDYTGRTQKRYSLPWLFTTRNDGKDFGGVILSQHFDSTRSRILDPITKFASEVFDQGLDSAEFFQAGAIRPMIIGGSYFSGLKGYPDTLRLTNIMLGYTGRTVMHGYATDPHYWEYYKALFQTGSSQQTGHGGGNTRAQNALPFTNVENGEGYFCGAVADSVAFHVSAAKDTVDNALLRSAYQAKKAKEAAKP